ncbi:MAG: hypothetical protein QXO76_03920 [Thermoproteota archaeon]
MSDKNKRDVTKNDKKDVPSRNEILDSIMYAGAQAGLTGIHVMRSVLSTEPIRVVESALHGLASYGRYRRFYDGAGRSGMTGLGQKDRAGKEKNGSVGGGGTEVTVTDEKVYYRGPGR